MVIATIVQAVNMGLRQELARDKNVVMLGEDIGVNGGVFRATDGLQKEFGKDRVVDSPLAELGIVGQHWNGSKRIKTGCRNTIFRIYVWAL